MLRKLIETHTGPLTDPEFHEVMALVTHDIQVNHISYSQRTSLAYAVQVATITHSLSSELRMVINIQPKNRPPIRTVHRTPRTCLKGVV